ncbi:DUF6249 domain-containing protein [Alicyclobacillus sp. ALC3]|uniref:DUF6249 domain-containing protein n=1 Tax=Alicyclobacillus sp. ALC3 TaxID=2796143 RepID=UPI002378B510|nr:DUF6249 domain-containing protein [Alicyclobacillus sp. ALC3]WDL98764.1 hypothetical protein JC200_08970 [Alicyclobacillus sp. ALC3]
MSVIPFGSFAWIPVLGILFPVFVIAVILGFVVLMRYLKYRERMLLVQRGVDPADLQPWSRTGRNGSTERQLRSGIITSLVGVALLIGLWTLGTGPWLLGGLIPLAVGIGELLTFVLTAPTRPEQGHHDNRDDDVGRTQD